MSREPNADAWQTAGRVVTKSIDIDAPPARVWEVLTVHELMRTWMSPPDVDIQTDWTVGQPIVIRGTFNGARFENKGTVLRFEPETLLRYNHLSSISRLTDEPANYSILEFSLSGSAERQTLLTVTLSNFPTEAIYKHLAYYWSVTLEVIKQRLEQPG